MSKAEAERWWRSQAPFGIGQSMNFVLQPFQLFLVILAGWLHRQRAEVIEYLQTENQVLKEKFGLG